MKAYSGIILPHLTKYAAYSTAELSSIEVVPYLLPLRHQTPPQVEIPEENEITTSHW